MFEQPVWENSRGVIVDGATRRPLVMGIVNVTPDSFSDGGRWADLNAAVDHARRLVDDGADILDIGGESTRPGAIPVPVDEELRRVVPVIEKIATVVQVKISVDTSKPRVARAALAAGATIVNDVTALGDEAMADAVREAGAAAILMHMQGTPQTMQLNPTYDDVVAEVIAFLGAALHRAVAAGIPAPRIALDPGLGFGKRTAHNLLLLRHFDRLASLHRATVCGASRKGFLAKITGRDGDRTVASVTAALAAAARGAAVVRVHDVAATVDAIKLWSEINAASAPPPRLVEGST